ncbi:MAG: hypothetical protein QXR88_00855 [Candidatus Pacearchaeota archaeon]
MNKYKILMIVDGGFLYPGGYQKRCEIVSKILSDIAEIDTIVLQGNRNEISRTGKLQIIKKRFPLPLLLFDSVLKKFNKKFFNLYDLIYAQNLPVGYVVSFMRRKVNSNIPILLDYHGAVPYEVLCSTYPPLSFLKFFYYNIIEKFTLNSVNALVFPSHKFKHIYNLRFGRKIPTFVLPMLIHPESFNVINEDHRQFLKKQLFGDQRRIIFAYSGGMEKWQCLEETIRFIEVIQKEIKNSGVLFLIPEQDVRKFSLSWTKRIKNLKILSLKPSDVPLYLSVADFGLLFRKPDMINKVASPTKFVEYISLGVIPILTQNIGDISNLVENEKTGIVIDYYKIFEKDKIQQVIELCNDEVKRREMKERVLFFYKKYFSYEEYKYHFIQFVLSILSKDN